jgi:cellulose synthase/poly-beta-1,6-N-acetylglucosamine synthase-like glycosyltransferase
MTIVTNILVIYSVFVLLYFLVLNFLYLFLLSLATVQLIYYKRRSGMSVYSEKESVLLPSIVILAPAYNEEPTIVESVRSLLDVDYPELEVIVINDGSKDGTLNRLKEEFRIFPAPRAAEEKILTRPVKGVYNSAVDSRLTVIDKENGGKADSLNAGINYSRSRLFCAIDADSLIEKNALSKLVESYLSRETKIVALGGIVRIANDCRIEDGKVIEVRLPRKFLPAMQVMEYIRAFLCGRAGWNQLNSLLIVSGAFGLFELKSVIEAGGYRTDTVGEDMELIVRLHRIMREKKRPYHISFVPDPVCWTQAPDSLRVLARQRNRWQRGLIETMLRHWKMIGNPRYGLAGIIGMPYFLLFEMLGPVIELSGYIVVTVSFIFGWINLPFALLFLALAILFGVLLSLFALLLEEFTLKRYNNTKDVTRLFVLAVLENFGYRQLHSWWRLKAFWDFFRKKRSWGAMERKAFT